MAEATRKIVNPECWACGKRAPKPSHIRLAGWEVRTTNLLGNLMRECYCPDCFRKWGWPPETDPFIEH